MIFLQVYNMSKFCLHEAISKKLMENEIKDLFRLKIL